MSDVEGVRNLVGTGLIGFVGGILSAVVAFYILLRINTRMTLLTLVILLVFGFILQRAFRTIRPIFRERAKINAEVTGPAHRVAGRRARGEGLSRRSERGEGLCRRRDTAAG